MTWSSVDLAQHCLSDLSRTAAFVRAIEAIIQPGDRVLDLGSGTGVLGLAALQCGAASVTAVEQDPVAARLLRRMERQYNGRLTIVTDAIDELSQVGRFDVVLAELIDTWLLEEDFFTAIRHCIAIGAIDEETRLLPAGYDWKLDIGRCESDGFPFAISFPFYQWPQYQDASLWKMPAYEAVGSLDVMSLSARELLQIGPNILVEGAVTPQTNAGSCNAARLSGAIWMAGDERMGAEPSVNAPVVIPFGRDLECPSNLTVRFGVGAGLLSLSLTAYGEELVPWAHAEDLSAPPR